MTLDIYRNILSAKLYSNAANLIKRNFIMPQDNDPKHTAAQQGTLSGLKSVDLKPTEQRFTSRRQDRREKPPKTHKEAALNT